MQGGRCPGYAGQGREGPSAILNGELLVRVPVNTGKGSAEDLSLMGRLKRSAVSATGRPIDLSRSRPRSDQPIVARHVVPGGELNLDSVLKIDPGCGNRYPLRSRRGAGLIPASHSGVLRRVDAGHRRGHRETELAGRNALDLGKQSGCVRRCSENVSVVRYLNPLTGSESEIGVRAKAVCLQLRSDHAGYADHD